MNTFLTPKLQVNRNLGCKATEVIRWIGSNQSLNLDMNQFGFEEVESKEVK